ncbi:hypothetical protein SH449x_002507 [Pirellulaceae bacterium SH449]
MAIYFLAFPYWQLSYFLYLFSENADLGVIVIHFGLSKSLVCQISPFGTFLFSGCKYTESLPDVAEISNTRVVYEIDLDFGVVQPNTQLTREILIPHGLEHKFRPVRVSASCRCLELKIENRIYDAGEMLPATVVMRSNPSTSSMRHQGEVTLDDANGTRFIINVLAEVRETISIVPNEIRLDKYGGGFFTVVNYGKSDLGIPVVVSDEEWLKIEQIEDFMLEDNLSIGAKQAWRYKCDAESADRIGILRSTVSIRFPDSGMVRTAPVCAIVLPQFEVNPKELVFWGRSESERYVEFTSRRGNILASDAVSVYLSDSVSKFLNWSVSPSKFGSGSLNILFHLHTCPEVVTRGTVVLRVKGDQSPYVFPVFITGRD